MPFKNEVFVEDLHFLAAVAVLGGQKGTDHDFLPIYDAWGAAYPDDALKQIGYGISKMMAGDNEAALVLLRAAAKNAVTRADQAADIAATIEADMSAMAE